MSTLSPNVQRLIGELQDEIYRRDLEIEELRKKNDNSKKLTRREVSRIREWYAQGNTTYTELADIFDVNRSTISRIVHGVYW